MDANEKIARWLGYIYIDPQIKQHIQTDGIGGWRRRRFGDNVSTAFDSDITLWHGNDGLLAELNQRDLLRGVADVLLTKVLGGEQSWMQVDIDCCLVGLLATPTQLAEALIEIIDEETK